MPTVWKFVDTPVSTPAVLLDMNDGDTWTTLREGFDVSPPELTRSAVRNSMGDGGLVTAASYENRELQFTLELTGETEDDRNQQLKDLEEELAKPSNLLMYQATDSSNPVFFRTFRSDAFVLDKQFIPGKAWRVNCSVLAEPFAIGLRHDVTSGLTLTNDPASGTNPSRFDITGIRGDSPTPAFVRIGTAFGAGTTIALAQRTANNPAALTAFAQTEAGSMGTDTTVQANDATMSGAGSNFVRTTFATATMATRVTVTVPTASSSEALRGRYRVLVKIRTSATGTSFTMRYITAIGGNFEVFGPMITFSSFSSGTVRTVDLGSIDLPAPGHHPVTIGYSNLAAGFQSQTVGIQAARNSGTATLDMDYVYLMPADERYCEVTQGAASEYMILDGPQEVCYGMASGTSPFGATRTLDNGGGLKPHYGGLPMLVPGVTNRWYALRGTSAVTATTTWDVSYWPYWREVATA